MTPPVRLLLSSALTPMARQSLRRLMDAAFDGDFSDDDWVHALGGWHALIGMDDDIAAHASVVPRVITIGSRAFRAGYVEAVAVRPDLQRTGLGTAVMASIGDVIHEHFEVGVLSSGEWRFYERLAWERWRGPSFVRLQDERLERTPDDDDGVMVLRAGASHELDLTAAITCDERPGDVW